MKQRNKDLDWKTAHAPRLGWVLMHGTMLVCKHCVMSKAKQKNVKKASFADRAMVLGQRLYLDLSKLTIKSSAPAHATSNYDKLKVLACKSTGKKWGDSSVLLDTLTTEAR